MIILCDDGASQGIHDANIKKNDSTVVVSNARVKGQIQNIITYKMKKLIEQKLIHEREGECSTHAPNGTLDVVICC